MKRSVNEILKFDDETFLELPIVIQKMEAKEGKSRIVRFVHCKLYNVEIVVESFNKPISKMILYDYF